MSVTRKHNSIQTYDADGNMTSDGRFLYTWNAENRLVLAQELCAPSNRFPYTVSYAYDHKGRMVLKRITENDGQDTLVSSITYLWDNWNIIREIQWPVASGQLPVVTDNVWGLDLDGTLQGAGGVGGLLAVVRSDCAVTNSPTHQLTNSPTPNSSLVTRHSSLYLPTYDANGNITEYVTTNGEIVAHYDYSPFGEPLIESGELASSFTHRFSTKPWCLVTGLYEYQMRKYKPEIGRWLSRDPIGENETESGMLFCLNAPIGNVDILGLFYKEWGKDKIVTVHVEECDIVILDGHGSSKKPHNFIFPKSPCAGGCFIGCSPGVTNGCIPEDRVIPRST